MDSVEEKKILSIENPKTPHNTPVQSSPISRENKKHKIKYINKIDGILIINKSRIFSDIIQSN